MTLENNGKNENNNKFIIFMNKMNFLKRVKNKFMFLCRSLNQRFIDDLHYNLIGDKSSSELIYSHRKNEGNLVKKKY